MTTKRIIVYGCDTMQPLRQSIYRKILNDCVGQVFSHTIRDTKYEYEVRAISFIGRYLKNMPVSGGDKELTQDEVYELCASGKRIVSIWQMSGTQDDFANVGDSHAMQAIEAANSFGQHPGTPIFFAYERNEHGENIDDAIRMYVQPYFRDIVRRFRNPALNPKGYKVGVYSFGTVCNHLMNASEDSGYKVDYAFLAGATDWQGYDDCDCWTLRQSCTYTQLWHKGIAINVDWDEVPENVRIADIAWGHVLPNVWQDVPGDDDLHYKACSHTGCNYERAEAHDYSNWTADNSTTHSRTCGKCLHIQTKDHVYGSWSDKGNGTHVRECLACGYEQAQAHTKSYSSNGTSGHTVTCTKSGCNYSVTEEHTMSSWSDCGDGRHKRECTKCGYVEYSGHVYNEWEDNGTTHKRTCRAAGCSYTQTEEHTYGSWVKLNNDRHRRTCSKCGKAQTQLHGGVWVCTPDKLGHRKHCSTCGADIEEIHTMSNGTCTKCGYTGGANPADNIGDENE